MKSDTPRRPTVENLVGDALSGIADEAAARAAAGKQDAVRRERRARRVRIGAVVLVPTCLLLTAFNLSGVDFVVPARPQPISREQARRAALELLRDGADELQVYFEQYGRYPIAPGFLGPGGADAEGEPYRYELTGTDRYVLSVTVQDLTESYDSRQDPDAVFNEVRRAR